MRVKYLGKHVTHGVKGENKICFGTSWMHTNRFGAWKKLPKDYDPPPFPPAVKDSMVSFFKASLKMFMIKDPQDIIDAYEAKIVVKFRIPKVLIKMTNQTLLLLMMIVQVSTLCLVQMLTGLPGLRRLENTVGRQSRVRGGRRGRRGQIIIFFF